MGHNVDTEKIRRQIRAIKPKIYYRLMAIIFLILAGLFLAKGLGNEKIVVFTAVSGIFLIVAIGIWAIGQMAHTYKNIIESLLDELNDQGE